MCGFRYLASLSEPGRPNVHFAFTENSMFSVTTVSGGADMPKAYADLNRNLKKSKAGEEAEGLSRGQKEIVETIQQFPPMRFEAAAVQVVRITFLPQLDRVSKRLLKFGCVFHLVMTSM
jgi:hypothetical protein